MADGGRTPGIGWLAGTLGFIAGAIVGNQFQPLPANFKSMTGKPRNLALLKTLAVGGAFGGMAAGIGYALTGCECCTAATPLGTPLSVPTTSLPPPTKTVPIRLPPPQPILPPTTPR